MGEMQLPEAYHCNEDTLPHMHDDVHERFPQAKANNELDDMDPVEDMTLETLGTRVGQDSERFRNVHFVSVDG